MGTRKNIKLLIWLLMIAVTVVIEIISFYPKWVEVHYTYGLYPVISRSLRFLSGWIPISVGDLIYLAAIFWFLRRTVTVLKKIFRRKASGRGALRFSKKIVFAALNIFILFYSLWGLNYSRVGISGQLRLRELPYTPADLDTLVALVQQRLNKEAALLNPARRDLLSHRQVFDQAALGYRLAEARYPFLKYRTPSVKPSVFSYLGNYMGFQGYYNPFTGEAQVNTTVPLSEMPFVTVHEMAHQLGYARENEANFVGFLACQRHPSVIFRYSGYFDMYRYAISTLSRVDSSRAARYATTLHPQVTKDIEILIRFYRQYRNPVEPYITWFYDYFLKANNQPKGTATYNEVVTWLIAYYKKYGKGAL